MNEMDPMVFLAVFQEMLGFMLWVFIVLIVCGLGAFVWLLVRERGLVAKRLVWSQALGVFGGILALVIMAKVSSSGFTDAGGPADWFLIALVFGIGLIVSTVLLYTLQGCWRLCRR